MNSIQWSSSKTALFIALILAAFLRPAGAFAAETSKKEVAKSDWAQPKGDWVAGPIKAKAENGHTFCSLKNSFDNGMTIVFARDSAGSNSIAIEFANKKELNAGATYEMMLYTAPVQRQVTAIAATTKVLIAQLGDDSDFYGQLARKGRLSLQARGKSVAFDVRGVGEGLAALQKCADGAANGEKIEAVKIPLPEKSADPTADDTMPTSGGKEIIIDGKRTYINITPKEAKAYNTANLARTDMLQDEVDDLRAKNRVLQLENQRFESELLAAELGGEADEPVAKRKGSFKTLQKEIAWPQNQSFADAVAAYVSAAGAQCSGDFAHKMGPVEQTSSRALQEVETACMGSSDGDRAAALLFVAHQRRLRVISNEGTPDDMEKALERRQQAMQAFKK